MKKLMILLVCALFSAYTFAQTATAVSHVMGAGVTYYEYTPTASQYLGGATVSTTAGYDTLYFEIVSNKNTPTNCNARVEVTRAGTTDTYDIDLQGKLFINGTYTAIVESAANVAAKELADTTRLSLGNAAKYYRYYRLIVNDDNACATTDSLVIDKVIFKLYEK